MPAVTLSTIRGNFNDANAAGSVNGATVQQLLDFLGGSIGEAGTTPVTGLWQSGSEGFVQNFPGVLSTAPIFGATQAAWPSANRLYGVRVTVPRACVLHDLAINVAVASGNVALAIYDTGDASAGTYSHLYLSGSQTCPSTTNAWSVVGADPALSLYAGQQIIIAMACDNTTASFLKTSYLGVGAFPASYMPCLGTNNPKPLFLATSAFAPPNTISEANASATGNYVPLIIGRYALT